MCLLTIHVYFFQRSLASEHLRRALKIRFSSNGIFSKPPRRFQRRLRYAYRNNRKNAYDERKYKTEFFYNISYSRVARWLYNIKVIVSSQCKGAVKSASSSLSGNTGLSLSTVVSIFTVETVTSSRKAVSTREHLLTGWQFNILDPRGSNIAALAQSTIAWWNNSPWDHL